MQFIFISTTKGKMAYRL